MNREEKCEVEGELVSQRRIAEDDEEIEDERLVLRPYVFSFRRNGQEPVIGAKC